MAISINNLNILQQYLQGVLDRADHHAQMVEGISLTLIGAILWKSEISDIEVREYKGRPANMIWFKVGDNKYVLNYNHSTNQIDLKERTNKGELKANFDNSTTYQQVIDVFKKL